MATCNSHMSYKRIDAVHLRKTNYCFILCNMIFDDEDNLRGYVRDVNDIRDTFKKMNFNVIYEENKKASEMRQIFSDWSESNFSDADDCLVMFILSHGGEDGVVFGIDKQSIHIGAIKSYFDNKNCEALSGKPKLIFLQACRGDIQPEVSEFKRAGVSSPNICSDTLVYYCTPDGCFSLVHLTEGTFFIKKICDTLKKSVECRLSTLLTIVNKVVSTNTLLYNGEKVAQAPEAAHTLCSDLIFERISDNAEGIGDMLKKERLDKRNTCILIINKTCNKKDSACVTFSENKENIKKTFETLNFNIDLHEDLKCADIRSKFNLSDNFDMKDCFACVMLSCGAWKNNKDVIYGADGGRINIDYLVSRAYENKSFSMKPKLLFFVINKCTKEFHDVAEDNDLKRAGGTSKAMCSDTFVYYVVVKTSDECSFFLKVLCGVLSEFASKSYPLGDMVLKINESCAKSKFEIIPEVLDTLTQEVYFMYTPTICQVSDPEVSEAITLALPGKATEGWGQGILVMPGQDKKSCPAVDANEVGLTESVFRGRGQRRITGQDKKACLAVDVNKIGLPQSVLRGRGQRRITGQDKKACLAVDVNKIGLPQSVLREPTIEQLKPNHINDLKGYLDPRLGVQNWKDLGKRVFQGDEDMLAKVDHLEGQYYGGASPGKALMEYLEIKRVTVKPFVDIAKEFERHDITDQFKIDYDDDMPLADLFKEHLSLCTGIIQCLDRRLKGVSGWKSFAINLGCSEAEIEQFKTKGDEGEGSPTEKLIILIKTSKNDYKLSDLKSDLAKMRRNDAVQYIDKVITQLCRSQ